MASIRSEILAGIEDELRVSSGYIDLYVAGRERDGAVWKVFVDLSRSPRPRSETLDESLEGAAAWWAGPPKGTADVLSVIPEDEQVNLRYATSQPPEPGGLIRLYPPRYLEALAECWQNDVWADRCTDWLEQFLRANKLDRGIVPDPGGFSWLRARQRAAFELLGWNTSYLWGPPGTGKTTTLGAMLAQFLLDNPSARVLLLSTTNQAVDQALVSVDKGLEHLAQRDPAASTLRSRCLRVGSRFVAKHYEGREHLLPVLDERIVKRLAQLEAARPDPSDVRAYDAWKREIESVRTAIRAQAAGVLDRARLAAMTTTRAVFTFGELRSRDPYDLIVFDEASQVGQAHALALVPLGRRVHFAGDPKQLSPIVQSEHPAAIEYLGNSMFKYEPKVLGAKCLLNEQSRMSEEICSIVSNVFYDGELTVAADAKRSAQWARERRLAPVTPLGSNSVAIMSIASEGVWSQKYGGNVRLESAQAIRDALPGLLATLPPSEVIVLTPFRAQRALIRAVLRSAQIKGVLVSTVHRAQGSERHTVIFDPVNGGTNFLLTDEATRLVNVALSRAKARLVVALSTGDRHNPRFKKIAYIVENAAPEGDLPRLEDFVSHRDFPFVLQNKEVLLKGKRGRVIAVSATGDRFTFCEFSTAKPRTFLAASFVKAVLGGG